MVMGLLIWASSGLRVPWINAAQLEGTVDLPNLGEDGPVGIYHYVDGHFCVSVRFLSGAVRVYDTMQCLWAEDNGKKRHLHQAPRVSRFLQQLYGMTKEAADEVLQRDLHPCVLRVVQQPSDSPYGSMCGFFAMAILADVMLFGASETDIDTARYDYRRMKDWLRDCLMAVRVSPCPRMQ